MRRARSKVRRDFTCNKAGSEEFAALLDSCTIEKEVCANYEKNGKKFYSLDAEKRMELICEGLK